MSPISVTGAKNLRPPPALLAVMPHLPLETPLLVQGPIQGPHQRPKTPAVAVPSRAAVRRAVGAENRPLDLLESIGY
jgi:hypothetical protein